MWFRILVIKQEGTDYDYALIIIFEVLCLNWTWSRLSVGARTVPMRYGLSPVLRCTAIPNNGPRWVYHPAVFIRIENLVITHKIILTQVKYCISQMYLTQCQNMSNALPHVICSVSVDSESPVRKLADKNPNLHRFYSSTISLCGTSCHFCFQYSYSNLLQGPFCNSIRWIWLILQTFRLTNQYLQLLRCISSMDSSAVASRGVLAMCPCSVVKADCFLCNWQKMWNILKKFIYRIIKELLCILQQGSGPPGTFCIHTSIPYPIYAVKSTQIFALHTNAWTDIQSRFISKKPFHALRTGDVTKHMSRKIYLYGTHGLKETD